MNRTLKFRVWDLNYKDWVKDDCVGIDAAGQILTCRQGGMIGGWIQDKNEDFIVQQYTGLSDYKGCEIFEGDILYCSDREANKYCPVIFNIGSFVVNDARLERLLVEFLKNNKSEIVGNIFENKDLL